MADEAKENVMAAPNDKSVKVRRGFKKRTSAPLHTYIGIPTTSIRAVENVLLLKLKDSKYCWGCTNSKVNESAPANNI